MNIYQLIVFTLLSVIVDGHRRFFKGFSRRKPEHILRQTHFPLVYPDAFIEYPIDFNYQSNIPIITYHQSPISQLPHQFPQQIPQQFSQQFPQQVLQQQLQAFPLVPKIPQQISFPVLREFEQNNKVNTGNARGSGQCQQSGCTKGQYCVLENEINNDFYFCTPFMTESCQCVQGCQHQLTFIPFGQSRTIDTCGNKCTCNSVYGTPDCDKKSCFNTSLKSTKK